MSVEADAGIAPASETVVTADATAVHDIAAPVATAAPDQSKKASIDDTMEAAWAKLQVNNAERGEKGRFVAKDGIAKALTGEPADNKDTEAGAIDPAAADTATKSTDQAPKAKDEPASPAIDPPLSWSADMKAKFAALPPEVQTYVAQRDKETHEAISRYGQQVKEYEQRVKGYEPLDQLVLANKDMLAQRGVSPAQAFSLLLGAQSRLDADPVGGLIQIADGYGIDLRPALQQGGVMQPAQDPRVPHLEAQLREMQNRLSSQESMAHERVKAEHEAKLTHVQKQIDDFAKDKAYWSEVQDDVMHEVQVIKAQAPDRPPLEVLAEAYDRAIWANSRVRERIQQDQRKADEDKRKAEAEAKAKAARAANSVNVKSGSPGAPSPKTIDDTLEQTWARLRAS